MRTPLEKGVPEGQRMDCLEEAEYCETNSRLVGTAENVWRNCPANRYGELCPCGALYPAPLARPFSKGLHAYYNSTYIFYRFVHPSCAFGAPLL